MSDGELVRQSRAGRREAYEELVRRWSARILAFCHAKVASADAAEDLAQEAMLRGYRSLASLSDPDKFGPWLRGIALRVCLDWLKSKQRSQVSFGALIADGTPDDFFSAHTAGQIGTADDALDRAEDARELMTAVEALPETYREVLMLYYYEDVTYQDLALALGVSAATINMRLTKARALLRSRLSGSRR